MVTRIDVFADITCPFTHIGLKRVVGELADIADDIEIVVRAWPLEWVNGVPLEAAAVEQKVAVLRSQLGTDQLGGFRADRWPSTTIPALNLAAEAYDVDTETGLAVSIAVRDALFEDGVDVSDPAVLAPIAERFGLTPPTDTAAPQVTADYADGQRLGVRGSPDFWVLDQEFFCPALNIDHDDDGLTAVFDAEGLATFLATVRAAVAV